MLKVTVRWACWIPSSNIFVEIALYTHGLHTYKIPGFADIPQVFNVGLLTGVNWAKLNSIQSSMGIGEPPLFLSASVLFALRDNIT